MTRQIPQSPVHSTHVISTTAEPPISNHAFHVLPRLNTSKIWRRTPLRTTVSRHLRQPTSCRPDHPTETAGKRAQGPSDSTGRHALQMKHPWDRDGNCGDCNLDSTRQRKLDKGETKTETEFCSRSQNARELQAAEGQTAACERHYCGERLSLGTLNRRPRPRFWHARN